MTIDSAQVVALIFSGIAIAAAIIGVVMQNDALHFADLGEVPDVQMAFLGAEIGGAYETRTAFHRDLRAHYRRSAAGLSMLANLVLLVSVVAGVLSGWTALLPVAVGCSVLWIVSMAYVVRFALARRHQFRTREAGLEARRMEYNRKIFDGMSAKMGDEYAKAAFREIESFERVRW